jgi:hypothetical protein
MMRMKRIESSFRDPDGYMFEFEGDFYRAVNFSYKEPFEHFLNSGLYKKLISEGLIVSFEEVDPALFGLTGLYKVLKPEQINFISYPYEWSFNMLKDAAILTLRIQKLAIEYGMSLKDASAFNIQFQRGKPVFIDTLSFELYPAQQPWIAYRQFCQHFVAPLALMARIDARLNRMFIMDIDGIPLDIAAKMLPFQSRFNLGLFLHIFLHSRSQKRHNADAVRVSDKKMKFSSGAMKALIEGLITSIESQVWKPKGTEWSEYTDEHVHRKEYLEFKNNVISRLLDDINPGYIWDLGSNDGVYSRIAAKKNINVVSFDVDPACVDKNYINVRSHHETHILPLLMDLTNPSPALGWGGVERSSFYQRNRPDVVIALAIIHHLAITGNNPLDSIALNFAKLAGRLIIEFVPKDDEKVKLLLVNRDDIFPDYTQDKFEKIFSKYYDIEQQVSSEYNSRTFYLMKRK